MKSISTSEVTEQVNVANNILLNYLQTIVGTAVDTVADISPFISKAQILKLYENVAETALSDALGKIKKAQSDYSNAQSRAGRGSAITALNKYPKLQALIKSGISAEDLDTSQEMQDLRQLYADEPLRLLEAQIAAANKFINSTEVQTQVALDFNANEFHAFDVNNGDNNCQSRIFLMEVFRRAIPYDNLTSEEKLVLTLSNITSKYKKEVRDVFGILTKEVDNGCVQYGTLKLTSTRENLKIDVKAEKFYSIRDLIGMAISEISVGYMIAVADAIDDLSLKEDLTPYNRRMKNSAKLKPVQQLQAPGIAAMFACIESTAFPLAYKITRLTGTALSNRDMEFILQGIALVGTDGVIITDGDNSPTVIFELFAVDTQESRKRTVGTTLESLASSDSFTDYLKELQTFGLNRLIHLCDVTLDMKLQYPKAVNYSNASITASSETSKSLGRSLTGTYALSGTFGSSSTRSMEGIVIEPCHVYVSSTQSELTKIRALEATNQNQPAGRII